MRKVLQNVVISVTSFVLYFLIWTAGAEAQARLENPLNPAYSNISGFVEGVLRAVVMIALPIVTFFIVYAGFLYVSARGNATQLEKAHKNLLYVIIGAILILGAWVLATLIGGTVTQIVGR